MKKREAINLLIDLLVEDKELIKENLLKYKEKISIKVENYEIEIKLKGNKQWKKEHYMKY